MVWSYIKADLKRLGEGSLLDLFKQIFFPRGNTFPYILWLRIANASKSNRLSKYTLGGISYFLLRHYEFKYGIHANTNIDIGKGLRIVHGDGVFLNCKRIGENVTIYQGVTLGANHGDAVPIIEDDVTIYPGAVVVGEIILHKGCTVGANSYVAHDVDENTVVAGAPAKRIR